MHIFRKLTFHASNITPSRPACDMFVVSCLNYRDDDECHELQNYTQICSSYAQTTDVVLSLVHCIDV